MKCSCGGFLHKARFDLLEDDNFYIRMDCEDCKEEYVIMTKPVAMMGEDGEEIELGYHQSV